MNSRTRATRRAWAEGPAWSSEGQYFVFSDVDGNTQFRVLWDDLRVTPFRKPSNNSNGNSFDFQGRQISTEDFFRRVIRWELDGMMTVIAEQFDRQAAEFTERPGAASLWQHLVYRPAVR
jgi:gluconolactonase